MAPSNIYSESESVLLKWMNEIFESERQAVWTERAPSTRWIVNFDFDLMDGLVLATLMAHFAPFLSEKYFSKMYTDPATAEQCLNNSLLVLAALKARFVIQVLKYKLLFGATTDKAPRCCLVSRGLRGGPLEPGRCSWYPEIIIRSFLIRKI